MCDWFHNKVKPKLVVFFDSHEDVIELKDLLKCKENVETNTLSVGDFLFCHIYPIKCKEHKLNCPNLNQSGIFNPCLDIFSKSQKEKYKNQIIVPIVVVERKECQDFCSSITGKSKTPGFNRMKDQKLRLAEFSKITGCKQLLLIEGYQNYSNKEYMSKNGRGGLPKTTFDSALLGAQLKDHMMVHHTNDLFATLKFIDCMMNKIEKNGIQNQKFMHLQRYIQEKIKKDEIDCEAEDFNENMTIVAKQLQFSQYDTIVQTKNLKRDHSQIVSINKKENANSRVRSQMMLSCLPGVSEKASKAILDKYKNIPSLIRKYDDLKEEDEKLEFLKDVQMVNGTKKRRLGKKLSENIYKTLFNKD